MSNAKVTRAASSAVDAASAGLEKYFDTLHERVVSLLAEDRAHFTKTLEDVHTMVGAVANEQHEIRAEGKRDRSELISGVQGLAQDLSVLASSVQEVTARQGKSEEDSQQLHQEVAAVKTDVATLQARIEGYIAGSKRDDVAALQVQMRELRGDITPEQRQRYITVLLRMIAEWEASHPDDVA